MATNSLQSLHYHHHHQKRHHFSTTVDHPLSTISLKPTTHYTNYTHSPSSTITFSLSSTTSTTPSTSQQQPLPPPLPTSTSLDLLQYHLTAQDFRQADEETRRLIIALAGESAVKRGYVFFSEVQFINPSDLKTIDELWKQNSNNRFGYSIQKKIWNKVNRDFTRFFIKVGWMKLLDTEVVQYNYRAFPNEFVWELNDETPEGHLPLTNALRGTQLLNCILQHPAFDDVQEEEEERETSTSTSNIKGTGFSKALSSNRQFKSDYSF